METPLLAAPRFDLMPLRQKDAGAMFTRWMTDRDVARYCPWFPHKDVQETHTLVTRDIEQNKGDNFYSWGMYFDDFSHGTNRPRIFGHITLDIPNGAEHGVIGYNIMRSEWSKGYTTEAVNAVVNFALGRCGLLSVMAAVHSDNIGSQRVLEKVGFSRQYAFQTAWKDGSIAPMVRYTITRDQYFS